MYEIPVILMFSNMLLLMGVLTTSSLRLRTLYVTLFLASCAVVTTMLFGAHLLLNGLALSAGAVILIVFLADYLDDRYGIKTTTTRLSDTNDLDSHWS